jgi:type 1 fimbriae regulatory protein FimB/type 1 fimbriae regulatory protein FimE
VDLLTQAAGKVGRHKHRDKTLLLVIYRHGLRVSEAVALKWDQIDLKSARVHVNRIKNGNASTHYLEGEELRALRKLKRLYESPFVFVTERGGPMTRSAVNKLVERAGRQAALEFPVHPHMLRHACGFALANKGLDTRLIQDYLGHKSITHTVRYTQLAATRFKGIWR